jgi:hypothetical protein
MAAQWHGELQLLIPRKSVLVEVLSRGIFILILINHLYSGVIGMNIHYQVATLHSHLTAFPTKTVC